MPNDFAAAWWNAASAFSAASTIIAMRSVRIPLAIMTGDPWGQAESRRMVTEKVKAASDGYFALLAALPAVAAASYLPSGAVWQESLQAGEAMMRPGLKKMHSNAKRLTRVRVGR